MQLPDHDISPQDCDLRRRQNYPRGYGLNFPLSDYRPWDLDDSFLQLFETIRPNTKLDVYRAHALYLLAQQALKNHGAVLEVGAWRGGSSALLASQAADRTVYIADTWCGVVKAGPKDDYYKGGEHADADREHVHELLQGLGLDNWLTLQGIFPDETASAIPADQLFCLVHIDVDVYLSAKDTTDWVWPRLSRGGVIVFDDYGFYGCEGVTAYIQELSTDADKLVVPNLNGQAVVVKLD